MTPLDSERRAFLKASGATLAITLAAGCIGDDDEPGDDAADDDAEDDDAEDDEADGNDIDEYLDDAANYDGDIEDFTGEDSVEVSVGNVEEYGTYVMDPPAIRIDAGTTVEWVWIDDDPHTVTAEEEDFDSGNIQGEGETFDHTFDDAGTFLYYCQPHRGVGQKGAVVVE